MCGWYIKYNQQPFIMNTLIVKFYSPSWSTAKLLKQGYILNKNRKPFSKIYHIHSLLIFIYNIGFKTLLQHSISEPILYCDLINKLQRIVENPNFSDQFKMIIKRYKKVGYILDIM